MSGFCCITGSQQPLQMSGRLVCEVPSCHMVSRQRIAGGMANAVAEALHLEHLQTVVEIGAFPIADADADRAHGRA